MPDHAPFNINRSPDYDAVFRTAERMKPEEVVPAASRAFDMANSAITTSAPWLRRAEAIESALAWRAICTYMEKTRAAHFSMATYRTWASRPLYRLRKYLQLLSTEKRTFVSRLQFGTTAVVFYDFKNIAYWGTRPY